MKAETRRLIVAGIGIAAMIALIFWIKPSLGRDLDGRYAASPLKPWFDHLMRAIIRDLTY